MNRRIVSFTLAVLICLLLFPGSAAAVSASADASYAGGVVAVAGEGFTAGETYLVRVVNTKEDHITAMGQAAADGGGYLAASVTTGALEELSDYAVYVNTRDGSLAAQDGTIVNGVVSFHVIYNGNGNTGGSVPLDAKSYQQNESATVLGNTNGLVKTGYGFTGWTTEPDGSGRVYTEGAALTMGVENITLYARWIADSNPNDTGSGNGNPKNTQDNAAGATVTTSGNTTTARLSVTAAVSPAGRITATITDAAGAGIVESARIAEAAGKKAVIEIRVEAASQASSAEVTVSRGLFDKMARETNADFRVTTGIGSITFDSVAAGNISAAGAPGNITIEIEKVDASPLDAGIREIVGDRPVYDFKLTAGDSRISSFGGGSASISIPYTLQPGEDENAVVVYYIDDISKTAQPVRGVYNVQTGTVDFTTSHFSKYAVAYHKVTFADVKSDAWYYQAVTFLAARGITSGTGGNRFSPDAVLTRGQFMVMLMRAYGLQADEKPSDNFSDAGGTYYTGYLAAAKRLNITSGVGNNRFAPNDRITRQEMFTLLYNALELLGELPDGTSGKSPADFTDSDRIAVWAKKAVASLVESGKISGSGGSINPQGTASRAEMARMLYGLYK